MYHVSYHYDQEEILFALLPFSLCICVSGQNNTEKWPVYFYHNTV